MSLKSCCNLYRFLQAKKTFVLGEETVALPDAAFAAGGDLDALEAQFLFGPRDAVAGVHERVVEHGLLDLGRHPIGAWSLGAGQPVDEVFHPVGLEVAAVS